MPNNIQNTPVVKQQDKTTKMPWEPPKFNTRNPQTTRGAKKTRIHPFEIDPNPITTYSPAAGAS